MTESIKLNDLLCLKNEELTRFKLHLAAYNGIEQPLDVFVTDREAWKGWNEYRDGKDVWNREFIFTLIPDYHRQDKYVFGGIYRVINRLNDWENTCIGYCVELDDRFRPLVGRLIVNYHRCNLRGRSFRFENFINDMTVSEITELPYIGEPFPGYDNVNITFSSLEIIFKQQKNDWHTALENVKGVYVITDNANGKKYVGSAYGDNGIWSRWADYACSGTGGNDELVTIIEKNGIEYARKHFKFSILELFPMKTDNDFIIARESFWKDVLLTRGEFGYNKN